MTTKMTTGEGDPSRLASRPFHRLTHGPNQLKTALLLLVLVAAGFTIFQVLGTTDTVVSVQNDLYMPVVDPILEPSRPDLLGESPDDE